MTTELTGKTVTFRRERGEGPALVCVHGSADNHHVYDTLIESLADHERMAVNLPGRAGTDGPALRSVSDMADFVGHLVESEWGGDYVLVGHSLGGAVAIEHALGCPPRLKGLVLLTSGARLRVHPIILQLSAQAEKTGTHPPLPPGLYEDATDPAIIERATAHRTLTPVATGAADWRAADAFDRMSSLHRIGVPALIVAGTNDTLTPPKYAEFMANVLEDAELHIVEGAGHMLVIEHAADIARWIETFAARCR